MAQDAYWWWLWSPEGAEILYSTRFDYPYTGPPATIKAVNVSTRSHRLVAEATAPGHSIIGRGLVIPRSGEYIYYLVSTPASTEEDDPDGIELHRAALDGASEPELVGRGIGNEGYAVSPDLETVAYREDGGVYLFDVETQESQSVALPEGFSPEGIAWAPDGRSLLLEDAYWTPSGKQFVWVDLETGQLTEWTAPPELDFEERTNPFELIRNVLWEDDRPIVYGVRSGRHLSRYRVADGSREDLYTVSDGHLRNPDFSWARDKSAVTFWRRECQKWEDSWFGGEVCVRSAHSLRHLSLADGRETEVTRFETQSDVHVDGSSRALFSPTGERAAYERFSSGQTPAHGLYVRDLP